MPWKSMTAELQPNSAAQSELRVEGGTKRLQAQLDKPLIMLPFQAIHSFLSSKGTGHYMN